MSQYSSKWLKVSEPYPHVLLVELARCVVQVPFLTSSHLKWYRAPVNAFNIEYAPSPSQNLIAIINMVIGTGLPTANSSKTSSKTDTTSEP